MNVRHAPGLDFHALFDASPNPYLVLDRRLHIAGANRAYLDSVQRDLASIVGLWAWDAFPADDETVRQAVASFERVIRTKRPDTMALLRFDTPRPEAEGGGMMERYWSIVHTPVLDTDGEVAFVLQHPIDVTELRYVRDTRSDERKTDAPSLNSAHSRIFDRAREAHANSVALREESDRLNELFALAPSFMALLRGREHRFELANPSYMRLIGDRPIIGSTVAEALPDAAAQGYVALLDEVFESGEPYVARNVHYARQARPGKPARDYYLDVVCQPVKDAAGRVTGIFVEGNDVTDVRAGETALHDSQQRLAALVSASSEVLYSMSADWGEMRQLTGNGFLADTRTANSNWLAEYIPADERPRVQAAIAQAIRTRSVFRLEHRVHRADGSLGWTLSSAVPLLDANGTVTEWFGAASDVTERREAVEAIGRSNEELERQVAERTAERNRLWNFSPDLLLVIDFEGRVHRVNPAWTTLLGYAPDELIGRHINDFVLAEDHADTVRAYRQAGVAGGLPKIQNRYRHKDGSTRWISWVAASAGNLAYATGRDITAEKAAVAELARTQEALRQSQKMEAVGQLTGGLAHDFNNLLTGIAGSLEVLQIRIAQGRTADVERYIEAAQGAAKRAAALTHRLLAFSRRQTLDPKRTDVKQLVRDMEDLVRRTVGPEIAVSTAMAETLWNTLIDPGQLENALLNLCINARDAMPHGGTITIEASNSRLDAHAVQGYDLTPGEYLSLCVSDTGTGMSPEVMAKAFDPFFTTKPLGMGTGLGLSMVYGFVQQSGGQVRIHSRVGQGTRVCLHLPRHLGEAERAEMSAALVDAPRAKDGETVLIVDDEPTVRMLVTAVLEDLGYIAIEAVDGAAGLKILRSQRRVDLLVSDVGLPGGMNGRQLADAARVVRPDLKVLFVTGYAENAVLNHGHLDSGMHVLIKPFSMETLASRIKGLVATG